MQAIRLDGPERASAQGGKASSLVVLLHGLGADGNDLIDLAEAWADGLPGARFASPNAPFPCDMGPFGRQWFSLQDRSMVRMAAGAGAARPILSAWLAEQLERDGLEAGKAALMGFSQGAMMALQVGLRMDPSPAAILAYSGLLIDPDALAAQLKGRVPGSLPPVLLVHGEADEVVPARASRVAAEQLAAMGVPVRSLFRPGLGHGIDPAGLAEGARMLEVLR